MKTMPFKGIHQNKPVEEKRVVFDAAPHTSQTLHISRKAFLFSIQHLPPSCPSQHLLNRHIGRTQITGSLDDDDDGNDAGKPRPTDTQTLTRVFVEQADHQQGRDTPPPRVTRSTGGNATDNNRPPNVLPLSCTLLFLISSDLCPPAPLTLSTSRACLLW